MDRRVFLKTLFSGLAGSVLIDKINIDQLISDTSYLNDNDFVHFFRMQMELWVSNPRYCAVIEGIEE